MSEDNPYVEALRIEREGYVRRNLPDKVKEVDNEIRAHSMEKNDKPVKRTATSPRRQTT